MNKPRFILLLTAELSKRFYSSKAKSYNVRGVVTFLIPPHTLLNNCILVLPRIQSKKVGLSVVVWNCVRSNLEAA